MRHLRWSQIATRVYRRTQPLRSLAAPADAAATRDDFPHLPATDCSTERGIRLLEGLECGELTLLNQTFPLGRAEPDWRLGPISTYRLWTVTLHYHQWLFDLACLVQRADQEVADRAAECLQHYLEDWLQRCDISLPGARHLAWNPYAVATRLVSWTRAYHAVGSSFLTQNTSLARRWRSSIWGHAFYLRQHIEWDLRANHLLRDIVGLACAGRFFDGVQAQDWLRTATRLAIQQVKEQVLHDGGHFERSPAYHLEVMEDILQLAMLLEQEDAAQRMRSCWQQMAEFIAWLRHPDGAVPQLNDACRREVNTPLAEGVTRLDLPLNTSRRRGGRHFADSGITAWHGNTWTVFFDVGDLGPDYQPGHGHADTLTIDCSFGPDRLFVDPGCYHYDHGDVRRYDRSTAAHNTVCIDDQDSSEVWHIFRVGRRARPLEVDAEFRGDSLVASAAHSGFDHLPGRPRHSRRVGVDDHRRLHGKRLVIRDRVTGQQCHRVSGGFLLAPHWSVSSTSDGWLVSNSTAQLRVTVRGPQDLQLAVATKWIHPHYGVRLRTSRLQWSYHGELPLEVELQVEPMQ